MDMKAINKVINQLNGFIFIWIGAKITGRPDSWAIKGIFK